MILSIKRVTWVHFLIVVITVFALRLPAFWTPILDVDEAQFAGFADVLLRGGIPYIDSLDTKPLCTYYFFAAVFWLFGTNNMIAVHVATAVWVAITALYCYRIAKKLYSPTAGFWAALFYAIFTTTYIPKFIGTSIAILMMLPLTVSIDLFLSWEKTGRRRYLGFSGIAWGIACLFKYQAGINLIVVGIYLLILRPIFFERRLSFASFQRLAFFVAGGALVGGAFATYLYKVGAWDAFMLWSISGSANYVEAASKLTRFWHSLMIRGGTIVASSILLWFFAISRSAGLISALFQSSRGEDNGKEEYLILLWLILSVIPVCAGGKFYGHYFLQMYPALCVLASAAAVNFLSWLSSERRAFLRRSLCALFLFWLIVPPAGFFVARVFADGIYAAIGEENPNDYIPIANYIKARTKGDDRIFVWGFATPIYTLSNRVAASRFLWCDWMTGRISGTPSAKDASFDTTDYIIEGSWELFLEDLRKNSPVYFIDTAPGNYHDYGKYPIKKFPMLTKFIKKNYHLETTISKMDIYRKNE